MSVRENIDKTNAHFVSSINRGDVAAAAEGYTDDAIILPPGHEPVRGRSAIADFWAGVAQQLGVTGVELTTTELTPNGSSAYEVGAYRMTGASGTIGEGKYVVIWKHDSDGAWKWHVDIWNSNQS